MDYTQTIEFLYSKLPFFQRSGAPAYKNNLNNTIALAEYLGNPQKKYPTIHIAGTNGKGSVAHLIASILQEAGYNTGLCTSPHLKDFRERIKTNGQCIDKQFVTNFVQKHLDYIEELKPSFFELFVGMSFKAFEEKNVDIAVIETGLGGRLDSTNIISPLVSIITNIGYDHMNLLGNTLDQIAFEKAGIIKKNTPVIIGKATNSVLDVFLKKAREQNAMIHLSGERYIPISIYGQNSNQRNKPLLEVTYKNNTKKVTINSELNGGYQVENIATVLTAFEVLNETRKLNISDTTIKKGIQRVITNTGILGRWQQLSENPKIICDTAHNVDGIIQISENLKSIKRNKLHVIWGMVNDKNIAEILKFLPRDNTTYYFCSPNVPRGLDVNILYEASLREGLRGNTYKSVNKALEGAKKNYVAGDLIFVGGSTFVVAEVI